MIVSIHISKTAGTSFGESLKARIRERLFQDYGDWAAYNSAEAIAHRAVRTEQTRARRDELLKSFDVIHGHFIADKYLNLFPQTDFVAFFRDPYQQAVSSYCYLQNNPQLSHPAVRVFHDAKMSIFDYLSWDETRNPQSWFMGSLPVESLAVVGLTEEYSRSVALFNRRFGYDLSSDFTSNVNPGRQGPEYELTPDLRKAITRFRDADLDLYRRAKEVFEEQSTCRRGE
jgi:hypothetical protein